MSKKQIRITDPDQLKTKAFTFVNRRVNVILKDNTVVFGELKKVDNENLYLTNMRLKKIKLSLEEVVEFFTDIDA